MPVFNRRGVNRLAIPFHYGVCSRDDGENMSPTSDERWPGFSAVVVSLHLCAASPAIDFSEINYGLYCLCLIHKGGIVKLALRDKRKFNYVMLGALILIVAVGALRYFGL